MAGLGAAFLTIYIGTITPTGATLAGTAFVLALVMGGFLRTGGGWDIAYWLLTLAIAAPSLLFIGQAVNAAPGAGIWNVDFGLTFLVFFFFGPFGFGWVVGCLFALFTRLGLRAARAV
jgi:hypothetical protein